MDFVCGGFAWIWENRYKTGHREILVTPYVHPPDRGHRRCARRDGKDYLTFDRLLPGFGVRITPTGKRIFIAQGSVAGKKRRLTVGFHPDKTVATARAEAQALIADMHAGRDPVTVRTVRRQRPRPAR